jgi:hypothetical protein
MVAFILTVAGMVSSVSVRTVARWLAEEKIRPWRFRSWITPKDLPTFLERATHVLNLYERISLGLLGPKECVWSADEKTSIQARGRPSYSPPSPGGGPARLEHSYRRGGAVQLLAGLNVATGYVLGKTYAEKGFAQFRDFLKLLFRHSLECGYRKLYIILDNGSLHKPKSWLEWLPVVLAEDRHFSELDVSLQWLPPRSSWLNQIEIFFGLLQANALTPNNFESTNEVIERIDGYINLRNIAPKPFNWSYTTRDLYRTHRLQPPGENRLWLPPPTSAVW